MTDNPIQQVVAVEKETEERLREARALTEKKLANSVMQMDDKLAKDKKAIFAKYRTKIEQAHELIAGSSQSNSSGQKYEKLNKKDEEIVAFIINYIEKTYL